MADALLTRASLLARLGDREDGAAWQQFIELYGGLVYGFVRRRGLQDADAADLTQEVFLVVAETIGRWHYDRGKGSFRGWLFGITRNKLARSLRRRYSDPLGAGDSNSRQRLDEQPSREPALESAWEEEYQQQLFRLAAGQVQESFSPTTWQAFWQTAVEGKSAAKVGAGLGLSVGAVYVARSRVLARLVQQIERLKQDRSSW